MNEQSELKLVDIVEGQVKLINDLYNQINDLKSRMEDNDASIAGLEGKMAYLKEELKKHLKEQEETGHD